MGRPISHHGRVIRKALLLYDAVKASHLRWCRDSGEQPMSGTAFGRQMAERGVTKLRDRTGLRYQGLALPGRSV